MASPDASHGRACHHRRRDRRSLDPEPPGAAGGGSAGQRLRRRQALLWGGRLLVVGLAAACTEPVSLPPGRPEPAPPSERPRLAPLLIASPSPSVVPSPSPLLAGPDARPGLARAGSAPRPASGGSLLWAPGGEPDTLDPANSLTALGEAVGRPIFDCLVGLGPAFEPHPALAEHWETSPDGTRYTFLLRRGVLFQDGTPLDAEAVRYSLERLAGADRSNRRQLLSGLVRQVRVLDRFRLEVVLEAPFGPFIHHLAEFGAAIVSPTAHRGEPGRFGRRPVGTGPFRLASWRPGEEIVLERWNDGWRGRPLLDRLVIRLEASADARADLLDGGQVDLLGALPLGLAAGLEGRPGLRVDYVPSARALGISIHTRAEGLRDRRARQALNYAVDRQALVASVYRGQAEPLGGPLAPIHGASSPPTYPFDLGRARQLLAEAGLSSGLDLMLAGSQGRQPRDAELLQAVQPRLAEAGVRLRLDLLNGPAYTAEATRAEEDASPRLLLVGWLPTTGEARGSLYPLFHSSQTAPRGFNTSFFQSRPFDSLLDRATQAAGEAERASLYRQAVELLRTEAPWIFLLSPHAAVAGSSRLREVVVTAGELVTVGERTWLE